ncbi:MAG: trypsin-like peptidase domain-containing protein [Chloroflexota bacterium]
MAVAGAPVAGAVADGLAVTAAMLQRSTVHVRTQGAGAGSGVIWQPDGVILTNAHVARTPEVSVELWDGRTFPGRVTLRNPQRDLAAVHIDVGDLPAAPIADSNALRVGQLVAAVGNPLGLSGALTLGIIHAIAPAEGRGHQAWVQADVLLLPGNSGGPLADMEGRVIGINSMVYGGLGLAVPSNAVERFLHSSDHRTRLGISVQPVLVPHVGNTRHGLLVLETVPQGPAEQAGLLVGDIVIGIGSNRVCDADDLLHDLESMQPGTSIRLYLLRGGAPINRDVTLSPSENRSKEAA